MANSKEKKCLEMFVTVSEAADVLGITVQGVRQTIDTGNLAAEWKGRQFLIAKRELTRFKKKRENGR